MIKYALKLTIGWYIGMLFIDAMVNFDLAIVECYYGWEPWDAGMIIQRFTWSEYLVITGGF